MLLEQAPFRTPGRARHGEPSDRRAGTAQESPRRRTGHPQALRAAPDRASSSASAAARTVNQDYYHTVSVNVRLAFHITDWLAIAGFGNFGVAQVSTGFQGRLTDSLIDPTAAQRAARAAPTQAKASLQQISSIMGGQLEFTPFTGQVVAVRQAVRRATTSTASSARRRSTSRRRDTGSDLRSSPPPSNQAHAQRPPLLLRA